MLKRLIEYYDRMPLENGVQFYSGWNSGYLSKAILQNDGIIKTSYEKQDNTQKPLSISIITALILISLTMVMFTIFFILLGIRGVISLIGFMILGYCITFIMHYINDFVRCSAASLRFRAAKQMVVKAYKKSCIIPTLEEAREFSYYTKQSTMYSDIFLILILLVLGIGLIMFDFMFLILGASILCLLDVSGALLVFETFSLRKPSDLELETAIAALQVLEDNEF